MSIENDKILDALSNDGGFSNYEEEDGQESESQEKFYDLDNSLSLKDALSKALQEWVNDSPKNDESSEDGIENSEKEDTVLKTAVEIVMVNTDEIVKEREEEKQEEEPEEYKDEESVKDLGENEESVEDTETSEEVENAEVIEEIKEAVESQNESSKKMVGASLILKTFDRWKAILEQKNGYKELGNSRNNLEEYRQEHETKKQKLEEVAKEASQIKERYNKRKTEISDENINNLVKKDFLERFKKKQEEVLGLSNELDDLRQKVWDETDKIKDTTEKINQIESTYSDKVDQVIEKIKEKKGYSEALDLENEYSVKIEKYSKRLQMVNDVINQIDSVLNDDEMELSKEDKKELKNRYKRLSKKAIVVGGVIDRMNKGSKKNKVRIAKIENKINKLKELKI